MASGGLYFSICLLFHITSTLRAGYGCTLMNTQYFINLFTTCCSIDRVDNLIDLMQDLSRSAFLELYYPFLLPFPLESSIRST